ncbi:hypothetical protein TanjilG_09918 [Lupinus angustifolius]|uniref:FAM50A/XAP5 C-terminal domain-containing protein n=1 Tax=Lupinus angustifolius TaxID=3871 RepID=A0A1J7IQZ8_LUPAN|nr:hypothetical protein TanjilG_09918 [Lupinus angustifolius]
MSGMGDGYVGTAQDAILETAFKKETVGLVTREEYVEKRVHIKTKIEEEEKEKLQKQQQEEEDFQLQKRKKRKIKGNSRLSFAEDIENDGEEEELQDKDLETYRLRQGKLGKDPTVETSFLPDRILFSEREAEEEAERERLRKQWLREQEQIRSEPLQITYSYWDGTGHRRVRKGDSIGEFLRAVQQQLAPEFREIRTTSVENMLYVKEDLIVPHESVAIVTREKAANGYRVRCETEMTPVAAEFVAGRSFAEEKSRVGTFTVEGTTSVAMEFVGEEKLPGKMSSGKALSAEMNSDEELVPDMRIA